MVLSGQLNFDKSQPPYVLKFNIVWAIYMAVSFVVIIPAVIVYSILYNQNGGEFTTLLILLIPFAIFIIGLIILYTVALKLRKRFLNEYCARVESQFAEMPVDEATASLKKRGIITDNGFIFNKDNFCGGDVVAFNKIEYYVWAQPYDETVESKFKCRLLPEIKVTVELYADEGGRERELTLPLDRELFNFLAKYSTRFDIETLMLDYLMNDKMNFCRRAFGFKVKK